MPDLILSMGPDAFVPDRGGLFSPSLRRDLADLNAQYLELGLAPGIERDLRFGWAEPVRLVLMQVDGPTRERIAEVPFALFDLVVPVASPAAPVRVEDTCSTSEPPGWRARCDSFAQQAVLVARRLVDTEPLALRLTFGISDEGRAWLADCRLNRLAESATHPSVLRPRWRRHLRFWEALVAAARRGTPDALRWAHCIGLCLIGAADEAAAPPPRRRARR